MPIIGDWDVEISNTTYASRTNATCPAPADVQAGDYLFQFVVTAITGEAPDPTPSDGMGELAAPQNIGDSFNLEARPYGKIADSGDAAADDFTVLHATCSSQVTMLRLRAIDVTTPLDAVPTSSDDNGATTLWPGLTTVTDGSLILAIEVDFADNTNDCTPPSGSTPTFTELLDTTLTYVCAGQLDTAGPTGDKTHTNNNGGGAPWASFMFAFRQGEEITDPPVFTVNPVITGTARVGETLTCDGGTADPDGTRTYQWQRRA